jgi:hypothetical protein
MIKLTQKQKAKVFDILANYLDDKKCEILMFSGEIDSDGESPADYHSIHDSNELASLLGQDSSE